MFKNKTYVELSNGLIQETNRIARSKIKTCEARLPNTGSFQQTDEIGYKKRFAPAFTL